MRIVVLDGGVLNPGDLSWAPISSQGAFKLYLETAPEEICAHIGDAEAVFLNKVPITAEILDRCRQLRYIGVLATGYNVVDIAAARARGVTVTNVPAYSTQAVAQFVFAHLLALVHPVAAHAQAVRAGEWAGGPWCFWKTPMMELAGKTMGIVGFGNIGRAVARIAQAFGMEVLATSRSKTAGTGPEGVRFLPLDQLLAQSDVVSLHCPLFPETLHLMDRARIAQMKDGAILINTARGPLVEEEALAEALASGKLSGAGLDVLGVEPPANMENPLLSMENCNVTPHIAWAPRETRARLMTAAAENLRAFLAGRPQNVVTHETGA